MPEAAAKAPQDDTTAVYRDGNTRVPALDEKGMKGGGRVSLWEGPERPRAEDVAGELKRS
jgi:hypothetical protein